MADERRSGLTGGRVKRCHLSTSARNRTCVLATMSTIGVGQTRWLAISLTLRNPPIKLDLGQFARPPVHFGAAWLIGQISTRHGICWILRFLRDSRGLADTMSCLGLVSRVRGLMAHLLLTESEQRYSKWLLAKIKRCRYSSSCWPW